MTTFDAEPCEECYRFDCICDLGTFDLRTETRVDRTERDALYAYVDRINERSAT